MVGAFFAMLSWLAAMTKFELSYAYPLWAGLRAGTSPGAAFFHESVTMPKVPGSF
jgi:multidrug transporter EmrE-like cation transporter